MENDSTYEDEFTYKSTSDSYDNKFENEQIKILIYPFDKYEISVILDSQNRFICIKSIKIRKEILAQDLSSFSEKFSAERLLEEFLKDDED